MQLFRSDDGMASGEKISVTKRLAFVFCIIASGIAWAAIIGLILVLKPDLSL